MSWIQGSAAHYCGWNQFPLAVLFLPYKIYLREYRACLKITRWGYSSTKHLQFLTTHSRISDSAQCSHNILSFVHKLHQVKLIRPMSVKPPNNPPSPTQACPFAPWPTQGLIFHPFGSPPGASLNLAFTLDRAETKRPGCDRIVFGKQTCLVLHMLNKGLLVHT